MDSSNYPAEYGTRTGGQISFITRSGTNKLHGSIFEYLRNDAMDARNFFSVTSELFLRGLEPMVIHRFQPVFSF
ncbi:MAG: hypothetical protein JWO80_3179 [Bryobacterales bacterium]|nr:hypothetical protein [Bryobacterales bacterium]